MELLFRITAVQRIVSVDWELTNTMLFQPLYGVGRPHMAQGHLAEAYAG